MSALTDSLIKMATNQKWQMASCDTNESKTRLAYWNTLLKQHEDIFKQQGAGIVQNKHTASVSLTFTYIYIYQAEQHEHPIRLVFHRWWTFLPRHSFSLSFCHFALGRVVACLSLFARNDLCVYTKEVHESCWEQWGNSSWKRQRWVSICAK